MSPLIRSGISVLGCFLLTAVVVHTCVRIEVLNARYGYYLPRKDFGSANPKWRVAARIAVLKRLETQIADERLSAYVASHPNEPVPPIEEMTGPPYSEDEQRRIDTELAENALRTELRSWVGGFGLLQYFLAPIGLAWAVAITLAHRSIVVRIATSFLATCSAVAIYLAFHRGYFSSLGW
jgi:hypothetical protein